jgi:hypothetical protein
VYIPGPAINIYGTPRFVNRKTLFDDTRIKRKPPKTTTEDESKPGYLCWGVVGTLPSAQAVPEVSFVVEKHQEVSRETTPARIENPDDPSQHVDVDQTNKMTLEKEAPATEKNNSSTRDADTSGFTEREQEALQKSGSSDPQKTQYEITYKPPDRAL